MLAFVLFAFVIIAQTAHAAENPVEYASDNSENTEIAFVYATMPVSIWVGLDLLVVEKIGDFAFLLTGYDSVYVLPRTGHTFERFRVTHLFDSPISLSRQANSQKIQISHSIRNCYYITSSYAYLPLVDEFPLWNLGEDGSIAVHCRSNVSEVFFAALQTSSAFSFVPIHTVVPADPKAALIDCPLILPVSKLTSRMIYRYSLSAIDENDPGSESFIDLVDLDCSKSYLISPMPYTVGVSYTVLLDDGTVIMRGEFKITRDSHPELSYDADSTSLHPETSTIYQTVLTLETDQTLPRFPDSPAAFIRVEIVPKPRQILQNQSWLININNLWFVSEAPEYVFLAQYRTDYTVYFNNTLPVFLPAREPGYVRLSLPVREDCSGRPIYELHTNVEIRSGPDSTGKVVTQDGHVEVLQANGNFVSDCVVSPEEKTPETKTSHRHSVTLSLSGNWMNDLSDDDLCDSKAQVTFIVDSTVKTPLFVKFDAKVHAVDPSGVFKTVVVLPFYLETVELYTDGGFRLLDSNVKVNSLLGDSVSPFETFPLIPLHSEAYHSPTSPGRVVIQANLTDHLGKPVPDANKMNPGVYLATAIHRFSEYNVTCTVRSLITVPLISVPFASIMVKKSTETSLCPRGVQMETIPFQLYITNNHNENPLVLWHEDTGTAIPIERGVHVKAVTQPGRYQVVDPESGEYSWQFSLQESDYEIERDFYFTLIPRRNKTAEDPIHDLAFHYPASLDLSISLADCHPFTLSETMYSSAKCPSETDVFDRTGPSGTLFLRNLPHVDVFILNIEVADVCAFTKRTQLLPFSTTVPLQITRLECRSSCDGYVTVTPMFVDPYTMHERKVDANIPYAEYYGYIDGVLRSRSAQMHERIFASSTSKTILLSVGYRITQSDAGITRELFTECTVEAPPVFSPRVDLPVFCPGSSDAHIVFDGLNFEGVVAFEGKNYTTNEIRSVGIGGVSAGSHNLTFYSETCAGNKEIYVFHKPDYDVLARVVATPNLKSSSIRIMPGGEFNRIYADMLSPKDRQYIQDDGSGSDTLSNMPNGQTVKIMVPYPETYAHIREDFCSMPLKLSAGRLADFYPENPLSIEKFQSVNDARDDAKARDARKLDDKTGFDEIIEVIIGEKVPDEILHARANQLRMEDDTTIISYQANGRSWIVHWKYGNTSDYPKSPQERPRARRSDSGMRTTLTRVTCSVSPGRMLSCPLCSDAEIKVTTDALGDVILVWSDGVVTDTAYRGGLRAGSYIVMGIERGGDATLNSPFCVITVEFSGLLTEIESVSVDTVRGCGIDARAEAWMHVRGVYDSLSLTFATDPRPVSCADPRFQPNANFSMLVDIDYVGCVCDGAVVRCMRNFVKASRSEQSPDIVSIEDTCEGMRVVVKNAVGNVRVTMGNETKYGFTTIFPRPSANTTYTATILDDRECPIYSEITPLTTVDCSSILSFASESESVSNNTFDCIIDSNVTVAEAVDEILWCANEELQITGDNAPIINVSIAFPLKSRLDMKFISFSAQVFVPTQQIFWLDVVSSSELILSSNIVTISYGITGGVLTLPGDSNFGGINPNQQINLQYGQVDFLTIVLPDGGSTNLINIAYMPNPVLNLTVIANRTSVIQVLTTRITRLELYLPSATTRLLRFSTNGGSIIDELVIFLPNARVVVNSTTNQTTSSNITLEVACGYINEYPGLISSATGGYGGPIVRDLADCVDFGGVDTPSQSPSRSERYYEPKEFPEGLIILLSMIFMVSMIVMVMLFFWWARL